MCFNRFAGLNSATTCNKILDALYFAIKEGAQCQLSERRGYKRSVRQAENSVYGPPRIIVAERNIGNISTLSSLITEGAQLHPIPNRRYKRNQIPLDEFSLVLAHRLQTRSWLNSWHKSEQLCKNPYQNVLSSGDHRFTVHRYR